VSRSVFGPLVSPRRPPGRAPGAALCDAAFRAATQVGAEIRMRMRSAATPIALVAFFAAAFFWIPDPQGHAASLTWDLPGGRVQAPLYSAGYVGFALAILSGVILAMSGFYLVAGSVRRDRERGIGAILAATPLSKAAYLGGKFAAHFAYLLVLDVLALGAGVVAFVWYGTGTFTPVSFAVPYLLLTVPAMAACASLAVLFDVAPVLRSRGGLVLWFFVFLFGLVWVPMKLAGMDMDASPHPVAMRRPIFDPAGLATAEWLVRQTVPADAYSVSSGHIVRSEPIERVPWKGVAITPGLVALRAFNLLLALLPLLPAIALFDRFDPARSRRRVRKPGVFARLAGRLRSRGPAEAVVDGDRTPRAAVALSPVAPLPSAKAAILAEARLVWESASFVKWPLAAAAILAGLLPGNFAQAAFLLLLVPVISEAAARERLAGTSALVFSQPSVPRSPVLWKTASMGLVVLALGAPLTVKCLLVSPVRGLACLGGLAAVAALSVAMGSLSGGGKLFTGLYLVAWYMGLSNLAAADFTAALSVRPEPAWTVIYMGVGAAMVSVALVRERSAATA
jgi:ABC-2 family transporter protein